MIDHLPGEKMSSFNVAPVVITDRKIRLAIIGLGRVANTHLDAVEKLSEELEIVAVCDKSENNLQLAKKRFNAACYTDFEKCLEETNADIVVLCTPSGLHPIQTIKAAEYGKHVITEKPMATKWSDGLEMLDACERNGVKLFVVKQNRFNEPLQLLKQAIDSGRFGKIYLANLNVFWARGQEYYNQGTWRGTWRMDGGCFMNQASHYFDLLHWLIGPVESIFANTATLDRNIEAEDTGVVSVKWRNGALGSLNVTVLTYPEDREGSVTIIGEKGTVRIAGKALNQIEEWTFADKHEMDTKIDAASYTTDSVYGFGHIKYYQNIIGVFKGEQEPITSGESGLKTLELLVAAYLSARDRQLVCLPLEI